VVGIDPMSQMECGSGSDIDANFPGTDTDLGRFSAYLGPDPGPFGYLQRVDIVSFTDRMPKRGEFWRHGILYSTTL
jgi:hypothetical protein